MPISSLKCALSTASNCYVRFRYKISFIGMFPLSHPILQCIFVAEKAYAKFDLRQRLPFGDEATDFSYDTGCSNGTTVQRIDSLWSDANTDRGIIVECGLATSVDDFDQLMKSIS